MTTTNLTERPIFAIQKGYQYTETIAGETTGDSVIIPALIAGKNITCRLICGANTGKVQTTTSVDSAVAAGTATWVDWALGDVTLTKTDVTTGPITGIRGVSVSGEVTLEVVI